MSDPGDARHDPRMAASSVLETDAWRLRVPATLRPDAPLICIPTIHPRGDQRLIRCAQVALDAGFRVHFVWPGAGTPSRTAQVSETLIPVLSSFRERAARIRHIAKLAGAQDARLWHIHDLYFLARARAWSRRTRRAVVYDVHEYYGSYYSSRLPLPGFLRPAVKALIDRLQVAATARIGGANLVAEAMAAPYRRRGVPVAVTPNYPLREHIAGVPVRPFAERARRVIHTGTLSRPYGAQTLIDLAVAAHARGSELTFDVVARFPNRTAEAEFLAAMRDAGDPPNLRLIDPVPAHDVPALLAGYGVGLSVLAAHGQNEVAIPTKLYEYALLGLAIVGTDRAAQRTFVEDHAVGEVFADDDIAGMLAAVERYAGASADVSAAVEGRAESARAHLVWEADPARSLTALLTELSQRPPR